MMKDHSGKILFVGAMVVIALISRFAYPRLYYGAAGNAAGNSAASEKTVPQFVFPALSLETFSGKIETSSPSSADSAGSRGAVAEGSSLVAPTIADIGAVSVSPMGAIVNSVFSRVNPTDPPSFAAQAALVADLTTGTEFMGENTTERWPLASLTKLMTATVALDKLSSAQKITITADAFNADPTEKSLHVGDTYTTTDLLRFLLLPSSNVAAEALADAYGRTQFIAEMNARAAAWGMADTRYADPSGLAVGSQSTAADLVLLAQKIYAGYPKILAITRAQQATVTEIDSGKQVVVKNINAFSGEQNFIGGKTGYTDQADGNLFSLFSYEGHPIVIVVLGTDDGARFANTEALYNWFAANFRT